MILTKPIITERLILRTLEPQDIGNQYLSWMQDPEVTQYLEARFSPPTNTGDLFDFVNTNNKSHNTILLGIFIKGKHSHIGNIKIGPIQTAHARTDIGYILGDKSSWRKGYATEAIKAATQYAIEHLNLKKIKAGCYELNVGSAKALMRSGFTHEATKPYDCIYEGRRISSLIFSRNV